MSEKPHILHLGWSFSPHVSRWLEPLKERGFEISLISYGGDHVPGVFTHPVKKSAFGKLGYALAIPEVKRIARLRKPDLIHAHYAAGFGLWGAKLKRALKCPLIISCLGTDIVSNAHAPLLGGAVRSALGAADALIAPSEFLLGKIRGLAESYAQKTTVVTFGMDVGETEPLYRNRENVDGPVRVLFFKHHRSEYGPEVALEAFALALQKRPYMRLTLGGRGPLTEALQQRACELQIEESVSFPGFIQPERALNFIAEHDLMFMPTQVEESFGVAALEAAAVGVPTVASDTGGIPEVVLQKQTGLLVAPDDIRGFADALVTLAEDASLRKTYGDNARRMVVERFDWDKRVNQLSSIYRGLL